MVWKEEILTGVILSDRDIIYCDNKNKATGFVPVAFLSGMIRILSDGKDHFSISSSWFSLISRMMINGVSSSS